LDVEDDDDDDDDDNNFDDELEGANADSGDDIGIIDLSFFGSFAKHTPVSACLIAKRQ